TENPTFHWPLNPQPGGCQCYVLLFLGAGSYAVNRSLSGETVGALIYAAASAVVAEGTRRALQLAGAADRIWRRGGDSVAARQQRRRRLAAACRINWSARCSAGCCRQGYHPQHVIDRIQPA